MRVIQSSFHFPLSVVKPLEGLLGYRAYCLAATRQAVQMGTRMRERSPVTGGALEPYAQIDGFNYLWCVQTGSLFLERVAPPAAWGALLAEVSLYRDSPEAFHAQIATSRDKTVYAPKVGWVESTLRMQGIRRPRVMEVVTPPSPFTRLLRESGFFGDLVTVDDMDAVMGEALPAAPVHAAILFESLDRVDDPEALLRATSLALTPGGLLFVTAMVSTGFDMAVLGSRNLYLFPPDRINCFSLHGLELLVRRMGFELVEVSTPGVLDVEIVQAHLRHYPDLPLSAFERSLVAADDDTQTAFQTFLQQQRLSSFARLVGRKR